MKPRWNQAFSLAMLSLVVACIATLDTRSSVDGVLEYIEGVGALDLMEEGFELAISHALTKSKGVLAQFTIGHEKYSPG